MLVSTRTAPEPRVTLENEHIRVDFDPRTSDTMYNYIWVRHPISGEREPGEWERVHNFGIDVRSYRSDTSALVNCIGMNQQITREGQALRVTYPDPLVQYRQFDDKVSPLKLVRQYPDFTPAEVEGLVHARASLEFTYTLDPGKPSFTCTGRVIAGNVLNVVHIVSALWTENRALPTHGYYEGFGEFEYDITRPEAFFHRDVNVENVAYFILYRRDGNGVPYAFLPLSPEPAEFNNYFNNWKCLYDFKLSCLNQQYIAQDAAVNASNDTGYTSVPGRDGSLPGVRVAFFPDLGWLAGGTGTVLRDRIEERIVRDYLGGSRRDYWDRAERHQHGRLTLRSLNATTAG